jgi:hypothetical protein
MKEEAVPFCGLSRGKLTDDINLLILRVVDRGSPLALMFLLKYWKGKLRARAWFLGRYN